MDKGRVHAEGPRRARWWRWVAAGLAALVSALALLAWTSTGHFEAFGANPEGDRLRRMQSSPRFREGTFSNASGASELAARPGWSTAQEFLFGQQQRTPPGPLPMARDTAQLLSQPPQSGLRVTWLGHSTLLVEIDGTRLLLDPVWGERASPSSLVGPKRFHAPPLALEQLPEVDAIVLSHDHYDHLDMSTIRALASRKVPFYAPLGLGAHLERWGVPPERVVELDWWQEVSLPSGLRLVATPAQHFSGRSLTDRNRTLWASWTLLGLRHRVFFSGDTGLAPEFPEIGQRYGPFDLTMFEVGAYHPSWGGIHLGPQQALVAHEQVRGRRMLPVHWGTFVLAMHAWDEPAETLAQGARARGIELVTPRLGRPVEPTLGAQGENFDPWWREVAAP
jgi:L-ascorbate metabolism protein UlaG (beta-lactamase superfamily)